MKDPCQREIWQKVRHFGTIEVHVVIGTGVRDTSMHWPGEIEDPCGRGRLNWPPFGKEVGEDQKGTDLRNKSFREKKKRWRV